MIQQKHFHILYYQKYIKYSLLLCVFPVLGALFPFNWGNIRLALTQDLAILVACFVLISLMLIKGHYLYSSTHLTINKGIFLSQSIAIPLGEIAVIEIVRPLTYRLLGASKVTMYFSSNSSFKKTSVVLGKRSAEAFCHTVMPVNSDIALFEPSGAERLTFVMLSLNLVTSSIFGIMTVKNIADIIGKELQDFAFDSFNKFELLFEKVLPTSLAFFTAILFLVFTLALVSSIIRTAFFKVCRNNGVMITKGGLLTKFERRIACSHIIMCDVRMTPAARLLRRYPVFISAGSYHGSDTPVFAFSPTQRHRLQKLLPEFELGVAKFAVPYNRNVFQFIWQQLIILGLVAVAWALAAWFLPEAVPVLVVPLILALASLANAIDGFGKENIYRQPNRTIFAVYSRFFTRHEVCIFTQDFAFRTWRTPFYFLNGRSDIYLSLPYRRRLRIRGIQFSFAKGFELLQ